jgi:hypothetical protein
MIVLDRCERDRGIQPDSIEESAAAKTVASVGLGDRQHKTIVRELHAATAR